MVAQMAGKEQDNSPVPALSRFDRSTSSFSPSRKPAKEDTPDVEEEEEVHSPDDEDDEDAVPAATSILNVTLDGTTIDGSSITGPVTVIFDRKLAKDKHLPIMSGAKIPRNGFDFDVAKHIDRMPVVPTRYANKASVQVLAYAHLNNKISKESGLRKYDSKRKSTSEQN